ncbi:DUF1566 domain-containing protein [Pseudomonas hefeiensis]|uniref:DUF1566 domain-containing protein n=1 Tax=Pseudomonas hefeiensis TaxID=2738125 RepID=A0ABY9G4B7_9PSED|nr:MULTISPECIES: DUF1566 domain-containing protein [unclassified Pseudomonas]WLH10344.1 DUF1566 domain-containing protein [Pseudomonas sp. FP205]WLH93421.1 DUF1566 domain-containing protein [Pseudomonas sp. FP53]WLI37710.1 DUF1566 domain-containing protein [Pseudomonas sp. FP821]
MQATQLTTYTRGDLMISSPDEAVVLKLATLALSVNTAPTDIATPNIGEYWPGQGGVYVGIRHYPDGPHHLIVGTEDLGRFAWGEYGTETGATSRTHGILNTTTLLEADGSFPAAEAAANYTADGHHDYGLPSIGELNQVWQCAPDLITEGAYWSSSQRSANYAFFMDFDDGDQSISGKSLELRVRPVRRLPIH